MSLLAQFINPDKDGLDVTEQIVRILCLLAQAGLLRWLWDRRHNISYFTGLAIVLTTLITCNFLFIDHGKPILLLLAKNTALVVWILICYVVQVRTQYKVTNYRQAALLISIPILAIPVFFLLYAFFSFFYGVLYGFMHVLLGIDPLNLVN